MRSGAGHYHYTMARLFALLHTGALTGFFLPFETGDTSRNNFLLALLTLGEGRHNNHHYQQSSCRQGIRWWEVDVTLYILQLLRLLGIASDLRPFWVPRAVREGTS